MRIILTSLIISIFLTSCSEPADSAKHQKLTENRIQDFLEEKQISDPIAIKFINDYGAILFYKGLYREVWDVEGTLTSSKMKYSAVPSKFDGVATLASRGEPSYITIFIANNEIVEHAAHLHIQFDHGYEVTKKVNGEQGFVIPYPNRYNRYDVTLTNAAGDTLYPNAS